MEKDNIVSGHGHQGRKSHSVKGPRMYQKGFTLIELMIAMLISSVVIGGIYSAYRSNMQAYITQIRIVEMQQNIRSVMFYMTRNIQMAGYDPADGSAEAGIVKSGGQAITISMDLNGDGDLTCTTEGPSCIFIDVEGTPTLFDREEYIQYALNGNNLARNGDIVGENISVLNFVYLDEDSAPLPDTDADGEVDAPNEIRSVQITVIIQDGDAISALAQNFTDNKIYYNQQNTVLLDKSVSPDLFRRRLYTAEVKCRNLGL